MPKRRPFAVFDIDGTLIRWQLYHAVADELARRGHFDGIQYQKVHDARRDWKERKNQLSFTDYERTLINVVDETISTISVENLTSCCQSVMSEYKDQVYTYTRDLIAELRDQGYLLFAISASQSEIVKLLADYYGFDDCRGSEYETRDGYFTGKKLLLKSTQKPIALKELIAVHDATSSGSIAVGDSESDIPMLESVEQPIAFNPTQKLFAHARSEGWGIVVERKNVIYELDPMEGYKLAS